MNTFFSLIHKFLEEPAEPDRSAPRVDMRPQRSAPPSASRRSSSRIVVNRIPRPYWDERGWRKEGGNYQGHFQTRFGNWQGYVTVSPSGRVEVYIHNPPAVLERHPHWPCFQPRDNGWFFVHPGKRVADVSAGILSLEKTIAESYERTIG